MKFILLLISLGMLTSAKAWNDPTNGKPFFPWVWEEQLKPTILKSVDKTGLILAASGIVSSVAVHQYDGKIYDYNKQYPILFSDNEAEQLGQLGNGLLSIGIAITQTIFDQENGLTHLRVLFLSYISHLSIVALVQRHRPNNRVNYLPLPSSFPSGHTTTAFASAGALAYSYGWKAGIPAYAVASAISLSRIRESRHWTSDLVAGAFVGTFWARASFSVEDEAKTSRWVPTPIYDGMMVTWVDEF